MKNKILSFIALCGIMSFAASAQKLPEWEVEMLGVASGGDFVPFFISSNTHGVVSQPYSALAKLELNSAIDYGKRFSLGYGASLIGGYESSADCIRYNKANDIMELHKVDMSSVWLQELYVDAKYRSVFLTVGLKENGSKMLNDRLSSGDMTYSINSRPMPGVRAGFWTPQNIPFTNGWVLISGELGYYKQTDSGWLEDHYNYYNNFITKDLWFNYKYCYFHTKLSQPFSVTIGMQAAAQFGGELVRYNNGEVCESVNMKPDASTFVRMLLPGSGGTNAGDKAYYEGNHIGSWDVMGRYRFDDNTELKAYYQSPWEDGSGIGKMNGFDGLYGIEYKNSNRKGLVTGAVVEYLDLMNQGGPIHFEPDDIEGTTITNGATGGDNYYKNYTYNGYQYYGRTIGSPVLRSPYYNCDGYLSLTDTRLRSFHVAVEGCVSDDFSYRAKFAYTKSWGTVFLPISVPRESLSAMIECVYDCKNVPGLNFKGQIAIDRGKLYGDNFGALLSVSYRGLLKL